MKKRSDPNNYCVYVHIVPNGKMYIGITGQKAEYRWDNGNGYKKTPQFWAAAALAASVAAMATLTLFRLT